MHVFVTGAGSATRPLSGSAGARFQHRWPGFAAATVTGAGLTVEFLTLAGGLEPAYSFTLDRAATSPGG